MPKNPLVSIIIPAYNGAKFLPETFASILSQTYRHFEILLIDDGSTDNTSEVVKSIKDERISYFYKCNEGVSVARNFGFNLSKGALIVFFDADDLMTENFLTVRVEKMLSDQNISFCCGEVENFPIKNASPVFGACLNIPQELLLYYTGISSCPSNYMFVKKKLLDFQVSFNPQLSSTADRFFLLELVNLHATGGYVMDGKLKYRINENSMSNKLSEKLVNDNELFYELLLKKELIPTSLKKEAMFMGNYILAAANYKISRKLRSLSFLSKAFFCSPILAFNKLKVLIKKYLHNHIKLHLFSLV